MAAVRGPETAGAHRHLQLAQKWRRQGTEWWGSQRQWWPAAPSPVQSPRAGLPAPRPGSLLQYINGRQAGRHQDNERGRWLAGGALQGQPDHSDGSIGYNKSLCSGSHKAGRAADECQLGSAVHIQANTDLGMSYLTIVVMQGALEISVQNLQELAARFLYRLE